MSEIPRDSLINKNGELILSNDNLLTVLKWPDLQTLTRPPWNLYEPLEQGNDSLQKRAEFNCKQEYYMDLLLQAEMNRIKSI